MESPLNEKIQRELKRKAAKKKNSGNYLPVLTLRDKVLSLVEESNKSIPVGRRVTPRAALTVMNRALNELSSLESESLEYGVLREVSRFISLSSSTIRHNDADARNLDLLTVGHPLSELNLSLTDDQHRVAYAKWLASDPKIDDSARSLVATAYSALPDSVEREHAFMRLRSLTAGLVPNYVKIEHFPITAAFRDGNSSAARRARVALQWRDKKGRWVEMGRGVNFRFRLPDGSIQVGRGNYVGSGGDTRVENTAEGSTLVSDSGLIEVSGVPGLESGLYTINSDNAAVYQARIPGYAAPEEPSFKDQFDEAIPSLEDLIATRRKLPIGWKDDGAFYVSDDNYAVIPSVNGQPQAVLRLDANGRPTGSSIGSVNSWSDVNAVIEKDQPEFDKEIARLESDKLPLGRIPGATQEDVISAEDILKMQEQRGQENKKFDEAEPVAPELGGNDLNGNLVPAEWTRDADDDKAYTRELPLRDGGTYPVIARLNDDGTYIAGHAAGWIPEPESDGRGPSRKFESWDQIETEGLPGLVEYLNDTFTKDNPIEFNPPKDSGLDEEPPTPPSGGVEPKTPSTITPTAPDLFTDFNVPDGAFRLRTAVYEPDGRVDEASANFTDDPKQLATMFTQQDLVQAMTQALLGNSSDSAIAEILNVNVDDNEDILDAADVPDVVIPQVSVGRPSGAGQLEFSAGAEFVPAESLFNALWEAGMDPNRVVAGIYDSANGNNDNVNMLIEAQGGVPSADEAQLVEDIVDEIRQIKSVSDEPSVAQERLEPAPKFEGSLTENVPVHFNNPEFYIPDTSAYIPSQPEIDENGYTDNPEIIALSYETNDLIDQMLSGISDGSGTGLLDFSEGDRYMEGAHEVPVEALRDAIQLQGINTNAVLLDFNQNNPFEPVDVNAEPEATPAPEETPEVPADEPTVDSADTPRDTSVDEEIPQALATPVLQYPGPENPGYHPDNTTLDIVGKVMGNGTRIRASRDGATGTVIAVQNIDSRSGDRIPYVRVRFDDGRIAVRSALKVRVTDQDAQRVAPVEQVPERPRPVPDVSGRLDIENPSTGIVATEGNIAGVNSLGITPEELADLTNPSARQVDFSQWGERAGEIARAGRERVTLDNIRQTAIDLQIMSIEISKMENDEARATKRSEYDTLKKKFNLMMNDTFGVRDGVTFGSGEYTVDVSSTNSYIDGDIEQIKAGKQGIVLRADLVVRDNQGRGIGSVRRNLTLKFAQDGTSHWEAKNEYLAINNPKDKKSGFATAYNRFMEDWYIANGVREVHVHAAGGGQYQGGFVWALNGFNWDGPRVADNEISQRLRWLSRNANNDGERAQINRLQEKFNSARTGNERVDIDKAPTPMELALVGWYPGAKNWIGKKLMANNGWVGVKRLDPKAKEQIQAQNYDQIRAARKRVETKENKAGVSREFSLKVNSNEFQNNNIELQPYLDDIRDVFTNNRSMAVLAPAAKTELARFISRELLKKTEDRQISLKDIFQLRKVLDAEYTADHPSTTPKDFGVGKDLLAATLTQIETNTIPGFTVRRLGHDESGYNTTYLITHSDSGQTFYLKEDQLAENYQINPIRTEVEAGILVAGLGLRGGYETRASETNDSILVMQQAGSNLALHGNPSIGYHVFNDGAIISSDDTVLRFESRDEFVDHLASPEDAVRITLLDLLLNNQDRHNGNILIAVDASDSRKLRLLPIDHSLSGLGRSTKFDFNFEDVLDPGSDNIYNRTMSVLTKRMKQDELLAVFRNEADRLRSELKNESLVPSGPELALIEKEWGTISNYRDAVNARLDMLLAPNGGMLPDMMDILKPGYWT
jgi:hypothetical protein